MTSETYTLKKPQNGAVLIVSLLLLMIMTMIGVTAVSTTSLEEKMASNHWQKQLAFQAASSTLREAETWLATNITDVNNFNTFFSGAPAELYWLRGPRPADTPRVVPMDVYDPNAWAIGNSQQPVTVLVTGTQPAPRYIIEYMGRAGGEVGAPLDITVDEDARNYAFRITAIGWGTDATTTTVVQSSFIMQLS